MHDPSASQTLEFFAYGAPLSSTSAISTLNLALSGALSHPGNDHIETGVMDIWDGDVQVWFRPGNNTTWRMWVHAIWSMKDFVRTKKMSFSWSFLVLNDGLDEVGIGTLSNGWEARPNATSTIETS